MADKRMYLTEHEAQQMGLPSVQEQIDRYNAALPRHGTTLTAHSDAGPFRDGATAARIAAAKSVLREEFIHAQK